MITQLTDKDFALYLDATTGRDDKLAQAAWRGMAGWDAATIKRYVAYRIAQREAGR